MAVLRVPMTLSSSYSEYDVQYGTDEYRAWEAWFEVHNFPLPQVPHQGWAARDVARRTVSALVFDWNPGDEAGSGFGKRAFIYPDKAEAGGWSAAQDARFAVLTIQLESEPLPFPV